MFEILLKVGIHEDISVNNVNICKNERRKIHPSLSLNLSKH